MSDNRSDFGSFSLWRALARLGAARADEPDMRGSKAAKGSVMLSARHAS